MAPPPLPSIEPLPPAIAKRLTTLHRSAQQMSTLTILGLIFPFLLVFAAPLGLLYRRWLSQLLAAPELQGAAQTVLQADAKQLKQLEGMPSLEGQLAYLHRHRSAFLMPVIVLSFELLIIAAVIVYLKFFDPAR